VLGILRRMYVNLTRQAEIWRAGQFRSEKLAQRYAKSSFADASIRA